MPIKETLEVVNAIGVYAVIGLLIVVALVIVMLINYNRSKSDSKAVSATAEIASDTPAQMAALNVQIVDVYKALGNLERDLGRSEGQNIVLMDNLKTFEAKREAADIVTRDKIYALEDTVKKQTVTISRHEGRIAELETEGKRKDETIKTKELIILDLTEQNTRLKTDNELLQQDNTAKTREIQLLTRKQSLEETIPLGDELLEEVAKTKPPTEVPLITIPTQETNELKDAS